MFPFTGILIVIGVIIIFFIISVLKEKKRTKELKNLSLRIGFTFAESTDLSILNILDKFPLFQKGHSQRVYNILTGNKGNTAITLFDYQYTVGSGRHSSTYNQTVALAHMPNSKLPSFRMGPEGFFHKLGDIFGFKDIDFTNYPVFSKRFLLKGENEAEIRAVFNPTVLSALEKKDNKINIEALGEQIIYYKIQRRTKLDDIPKLIEEIHMIAQLFHRDRF